MHPFDCIRVTIFVSRVSVWLHPCKNFLNPCIRLTSSVRKFSSSVYPFDFIRAQIFFIRVSVWLHPCENFLYPCIRLAVPFQTAWLSVCHPCACRAFACRACIPKERFPVRGHIFLATELLEPNTFAPISYCLDQRKLMFNFYQNFSNYFY